MSLYRKKIYLQRQIVETENLLSLVEDHPFMSIGIKEKLTSLKEELDELPEEEEEAKIRLLFSGHAVKGSVGIKSAFLSNTIKPFQELITSQTAYIRYGDKKRVSKSKAANTDLYLTALPTGSFGVELSKLDSNDLIDSLDVSKAMKSSMQLIDSTSISDEKFEEVISRNPLKTIASLRKFLKPLAEANSIIKMESGELGIELSPEKVATAYDRVAATNEKEEEIVIDGVLKGFLLESGRFEIITDEAKRISGSISEELDEDTLVEMYTQYLNQKCIIYIALQTTTFRSGRQKITHKLLDIKSTI
jgi:hypothetical protein